MKQYNVIFTPEAERQLDALYKYIADNGSVSRADSYVAKIVDDCLSLSLFPERGVKRSDIRPNLRVKNYAKRVLIAFSVDKKNDIVAIHGIFYGGQNFESLLRDADSDD